MLRVSFTYLYYTVDPIGFIEELCENKDQPELQCNGKCHLKKVTESSKNSEKAPTQIIDFKDVLLYKQSNVSSIAKVDYTYSKTFFNAKNHYKYLAINTNFRPPEV